MRNESTSSYSSKHEPRSPKRGQQQRPKLSPEPSPTRSPTTPKNSSPNLSPTRSPTPPKNSSPNLSPTSSPITHLISPQQFMPNPFLMEQQRSMPSQQTNNDNIHTTPNYKS